MITISSQVNNIVQVNRLGVIVVNPSEGAKFKDENAQLEYSLVYLFNAD